MKRHLVSLDPGVTFTPSENLMEGGMGKLHTSVPIIALTVAVALSLVLSTLTGDAEAWPPVQMLLQRPQFQPIDLAKQEKLQRQWQRTIEKARAQSALLEAWQQRQVRLKATSIKVDARSRRAAQARVMRDAL